MIFDIFYMLFNLGLTLYVFGNISSCFANRHQLPLRLQQQMLAHICLKYQTDSEGPQQQEILESLPKAMRSSISVHLFDNLVDQVYLFHGVIKDLLIQMDFLRSKNGLDRLLETGQRVTSVVKSMYFVIDLRFFTV